MIRLDVQKFQNFMCEPIFLREIIKIITRMNSRISTNIIVVIFVKMAIPITAIFVKNLKNHIKIEFPEISYIG